MALVLEVGRAALLRYILARDVLLGFQSRIGSVNFLNLNLGAGANMASHRLRILERADMARGSVKLLLIEHLVMVDEGGPPTRVVFSMLIARRAIRHATWWVEESASKLIHTTNAPFLLATILRGWSVRPTTCRRAWHLLVATRQAILTPRRCANLSRYVHLV